MKTQHCIVILWVTIALTSLGAAVTLYFAVVNEWLQTIIVVSICIILIDGTAIKMISWINRKVLADQQPG